MQTLLEGLFSPILAMRFVRARQRKWFQLKFHDSGQGWVLISVYTAHWLLASRSSVLTVEHDVVLQQQREFKQLEGIAVTQFHIDPLSLEAKLTFENEFLLHIF